MYFWQAGDAPFKGLTLPKVASISCCWQQLFSLNHVQFFSPGCVSGALLLKNEQYCLFSVFNTWLSHDTIANTAPKSKINRTASAWDPSLLAILTVACCHLTAVKPQNVNKTLTCAIQSLIRPLFTTMGCWSLSGCQRDIQVTHIHHLKDDWRRFTINISTSPPRIFIHSLESLIFPATWRHNVYHLKWYS